MYVSIKTSDNYQIEHDISTISGEDIHPDDWIIYKTKFE